MFSLVLQEGIRMQAEIPVPSQAAVSHHRHYDSQNYRCSHTMHALWHTRWCTRTCKHGALNALRRSFATSNVSALHGAVSACGVPFRLRLQPPAEQHANANENENENENLSAVAMDSVQHEVQHMRNQTFGDFRAITSALGRAEQNVHSSSFCAEFHVAVNDPCSSPSDHTFDADLPSEGSASASPRARALGSASASPRARALLESKEFTMEHQMPRSRLSAPVPAYTTIKSARMASPRGRYDHLIIADALAHHDGILAVHGSDMLPKSSNRATPRSASDVQAADDANKSAVQEAAPSTATDVQATHVTSFATPPTDDANNSAVQEAAPSTAAVSKPPKYPNFKLRKQAEAEQREDEWDEVTGDALFTV